MNVDKAQEVMTVAVGIQKGCNIILGWSRPAKTFKGVSDVITKQVQMAGRIGIEYDNQKTVIEKRENGALPTENAGLPWGVWETYPYLIAHKGQKYLRLYKSTNAKAKASVTWFKNGLEVTKEEIAPLLLASEFNESKGDCFTVKIEDLTRLDIELIDFGAESEKTEIAAEEQTAEVPF